MKVQNGKKKIDNKELEAQKQALEEQRKREQEKKEQEETMKYEIIKLETGLELIITKWCIEQIWKETQPKEFMINFIVQYLKKMRIYSQFESLEIQITGEFLVYILIFVKEQMQLDEERTLVLINICWSILMNENSRYDNSKSQKDKNIESDFAKFSLLISNHFLNSPFSSKYFTKHELQTFLNYFYKLYFQHFDLFNYVFNNQSQKEEININLYIETPLEIMPLSQALFMGKKKIEIKDENDEEQEEHQLSQIQSQIQEQHFQEQIQQQNDLQKNIQQNDQDTKDILFINNHIEKVLGQIKRNDINQDLTLSK